MGLSSYGKEVVNIVFHRLCHICPPHTIYFEEYVDIYTLLLLTVQCSQTDKVTRSDRLFLLLVFSPWAGLGRDQSSVRRLVWLWYAASWASS